MKDKIKIPEPDPEVMITIELPGIPLWFSVFIAISFWIAFFIGIFI